MKKSADYQASDTPDELLNNSLAEGGDAVQLQILKVLTRVNVRLDAVEDKVADTIPKTGKITAGTILFKYIKIIM